MSQSSSLHSGRITNRILVTATLIGLTLALSPLAGASAQPSVPDLSLGAAPAATERVSVPKAATSRLAQSDESL